jgi:glucan phosphoethanolaminetransferase (alkaline phosphatase superfamily)
MDANIVLTLACISIVVMAFRIIYLTNIVSSLIKTTTELSNETLRMSKIQGKLIDRVIDIEKELN